MEREEIPTKSSPNDVFVRQLEMMESLTTLYPKNNCTAYLLPEKSTPNMPVFCKNTGKKLLAIKDCVSGYQKLIKMSRVFSQKAQSLEIAHYYDYIALSAAQGVPGVIGGFTNKDTTQPELLYGKNHDGVAYILLDHVLQIVESTFENARFYIQMFEFHGDNICYDLLTDYRKAECDLTDLENGTTIPINDISILAEWVDQGYQLAIDGIMYQERKEYIRNSLILLNLIIEYEDENQTVTSTLSVVDFPNINYILQEPNYRLLNYIMHRNSEEHPIYSTLFNNYSINGFIFSLNIGLDYGRDTLKSLFIAGELGGIEEIKIALIKNENKNEIKAEKMSHIFQKLKNITLMINRIKEDIKDNSLIKENINNIYKNRMIIVHALKLEEKKHSLENEKKIFTNNKIDTTEDSKALKFRYEKLQEKFLDIHDMEDSIDKMNKAIKDIQAEIKAFEKDYILITDVLEKYLNFEGRSLKKKVKNSKIKRRH